MKLAQAALVIVSVIPLITAIHLGHPPELVGWKQIGRDDVDNKLQLTSHRHGTYLEAPALPRHVHAATFTQPLDHFDGSTNLTFQQRYWYSTKNYKGPHERANGTSVPVIVLEGGETSGLDRLSYLDHGILDILTKKTGGIGVVLEHRYYGTSYPPRSAFGPGTSWTVDELRWLDNRQSEADSAEFVKHMSFEDVDEDLTAADTPVVTYGGSYAGARAAHLRVHYPDLFFGAFASSAVTAAIEELPQYHYAVARGNDVEAIQALQAAVAALDEILAPESAGHVVRHPRQGSKSLDALLSLANVEGLTNPADLAAVLSEELGDYQSVNWDDRLSPHGWRSFLDAMKTNPSDRLFDGLKDQARTLSLEQLPDEALRLLHWTRKNYIDPCISKKAAAKIHHDHGSVTLADDCLARNWTAFIENPRLTAAKAWEYQVCTTWGYHITAPPTSRRADPSNPATFTPSGPKLISSLLNLDYVSEVCRRGYPPGKFNKLPPRPRVWEVNDIGGFHLSKERLVFIDGQNDPWREATPHSDTFAAGGARRSTLQTPFLL